MARGSIILVTLAVALSGCAANASNVSPETADGLNTGFFAGPALWTDPQNAPHPDWNWPTLSNPAVGENVPAWWRPIPAAEVPERIVGMEHVDRATPNIRGAGIAIFGSLVVVPGFGQDSHIVSLADPTNPVVIGTFPSSGTHRGAAIIAYPTGRLVNVFATSGGIQLWDITDPTNPEFLTERNPPGGGHKVGVVPGTPIIYNANADGDNSRMEIYDATDPENPVLVRSFEGYGCHHVYFWVSLQKQRSICAAMEVTRILDIADPRNPTLVVDVPVHHGIPGTPSTAVVPYRFSHFAILDQGGDVLIVGDETGGGGLPACDAHVQAAGLSASGPLGNVYFYDITEETSPVLKGWFNPGLTRVGTCTAHHGRLVPDETGRRDLLAMAFYTAGTVLVDFTNPASPQLVDQFATGTTWEAWYANGWLVTGDLSRGLDVLRLV